MFLQKLNWFAFLSHQVEGPFKKIDILNNKCKAPNVQNASKIFTFKFYDMLQNLYLLIIFKKDVFASSKL